MNITSVFVAIIIVVFVAIFLTEFMSNLALISVISPILMVLSLQFSDSVMLLSVPAAIAASCAFMLPMATPPNSIVFSSGYLKVKDMIRIGFIANLVSLVISSTYSYFLL